MTDRPLPSIPAAVVDELLSEVYAHSAHEIRGALGLLVAAVDELEDEPLPTGAMAYLSRGVARLERVATRYGRVAEALDGGLGDGIVSTSLATIVREACDAVQATTGSFALEWDERAPANVLCDPGAAVEAITEVFFVGGRLSETGTLRADVATDGDVVSLTIRPEAPVSDWPALPAPPNPRRLASRPGLWLALALLGVQDASATAEGPTLEIRWRRGQRAPSAA